MPRLGKDVKARLAAIPGSVPDPFNIPAGCSFFPRCAAPKKAACQGPEAVPLTEVRPEHSVRCTLYQ
jgi:peptide/nickel transport system ATP-binding protein